jgi:hypothetical protein
MAGAIYVLCAGMVVVTVFTGGVNDVLTAASWALLVSYIFHLIFVRPKVTYFDEGIMITNPFKEITVGWDQVQEISARYTMYILVGGKRIHAWAAQAPGRYHSRTIHPTEIRGLKIPDTFNMRPGESPRTDSGVAIQLARLRHEEFQKRGARSNCESSTVVDRGSVLTLAAIVILSCALAII